MKGMKRGNILFCNIEKTLKTIVNSISIQNKLYELYNGNNLK